MSNTTGHDDLTHDDLARVVADQARELSDGAVPAGQRWLHTFQLSRLAGRLLTITPDDRPAAPPPRRRATFPRLRGDQP